MSDTPTLPGTLPGLLQPGAPVIFAVEHITVRGWLVTRPAGWTACGIGAEDLAMMDDGSDEVCAVHPSRLALDLSRPEGVDRALRWLAERLELPVGPLPPQLTRIDTGVSVHGDALVWCIAPVDGKPRHVNTVISAADTNNPIEALRLACLTAGEVSGG